MIRISAVSYLNSKPYVYGIMHSPIIEKIELSLDMPSLCASKLKDDIVDIGLVPVAVIPEIKEARIITDYCISASGKVRTVVLASDVPVEEIETIYLDYQSRTSVQLVQILAANHWNIRPEYINAKPGYIERDIKGTAAAVVIGDRVFDAEKKFNYIYDLGEVWKEMTGLDFVFACWVANKEIDPVFIEEFSKTLEKGVSLLKEVIAENSLIYPDINLEEYFHENIQFRFDETKRKGLELFIKYLEEPVLK